ncbi:MULTISPECIES: RedV protein [unclassified Streptomyces]|uniref:RedV protein n=1 Tax=unclassified Streptomyces TaxID=2593676 RepID=UPI0035D57D69
MTERGTDRVIASAPAFAQALDAAAGPAALSPSSHNCQPWGLARATTPGARRTAAALTGADTAEYLVLALDRRRELTALAAHAVEMEVSCGVYWRLLLRGLAAQGWSAVAAHVVEADDGSGFGAEWPASWTPLCVAALRPGRPSGERLDDLRETGLARRTHRGPYRPEPLAADLLRDLEDAGPSEAEPHPRPLHVRHLTNPQELGAFASFVARHAGRDFGHRRAWRETHSFLRWSTESAAARGDGFTLDQLFGPLSGPRRAAMRCALAPTTMNLLGRAGYHRVLAAGLANVVRRTPAVVTMGFADETAGRADLLRGGARLADYWWRATRSGLSLHPISVVLQHDDLRNRLAAELRLPGRTFFVSRVGVAGRPAPRSHRRASAAAHVAI